MPIEATFRHLTNRFAALRDALQGLALTVIEDRPARGEVLLVERLGNLVEDLRGWTAEALAGAADAREAVAHPADFYRARQALGAAQAQFHRLTHRFLAEAVAYETIDGLMRFGSERGGEWLGWSTSAIQALEACREPLRALDEAFLGSWGELAERIGAGSVMVTTTNIGQQISSEPAGDAAHEASPGLRRPAPRRRTSAGIDSRQQSGT